MTLDELITALEAEDQEKVLPLGFRNPHSYRGDYSCVGFEPVANATVAEMLADARRAKGATYDYNGAYTMDGWSDCYMAEYGSSGEAIGPTLLTLLLAAGQLDEPTKSRLAELHGAWTTPGFRYEVEPAG